MKKFFRDHGYSDIINQISDNSQVHGCNKYFFMCEMSWKGIL